MEIREEKAGNAVLFRLEGRLDATTSTELEQRVTSSIDNGARGVAMDLSALEYISSAGLRVLLSAAKRLGGSGLALFAMQEAVRKVFDIAGFSAFLATFGSEDEALRSLGR